MLAKSFIKKTKENLEKERAEILNRSNNRIDIDVDGDETDEVQGNVIIEIQNQLQFRDRVKLSLIESALKRIDDQEYGLCLDCGDKILEKRLLINPHTLMCISCAESREVEEKQRKRF